MKLINVKHEAWQDGYFDLYTIYCEPHEITFTEPQPEGMNLDILILRQRLTVFVPSPYSLFESEYQKNIVSTLTHEEFLRRVIDFLKQQGQQVAYQSWKFEHNQYITSYVHNSNAA